MQYGNTILSSISNNQANPTQLKLLPKYLNSNTVKKSMEGAIKVAFIGLGQAGGRIAREAAELGFPAFIVNTSQADMREHDSIIPKSNQYFTPLLDAQGRPTSIQGTGKDSRQGAEIASENMHIYEELVNRDEIRYADFVFVCTSLGGGSGAGAMEMFVPELVAFKDEAYREDMAKDPDHCLVGLITCLPSDSERGVATYENTTNALALIEEWRQNGLIGGILPIDNQHISSSDFTKNFISEVDKNMDALSLGNSHVASLLMMLISAFHLDGQRATIDTGEIFHILGVPGYINIKHSLNDVDIIKDYKSRMSENGDYELMAKNYAKKVIESEDFLCEIDYKGANTILAQFIEPIEYPRNLTDILNATIHEFIGSGTLHGGKSQMKAQVGLSLILAINTSTIPSRYEEIANNYEREVQIEEEKLKRLQEAQSKQLFKRRDENTTTRRQTPRDLARSRFSNASTSENSTTETSKFGSFGGSRSPETPRQRALAAARKVREESQQAATNENNKPSRFGLNR